VEVYRVGGGDRGREGVVFREGGRRGGGRSMHRKGNALNLKENRTTVKN